MSDPTARNRSQGVSPLVLVLSLLLAIASTAVVVLYLRPNTPANTHGAETPFEQTGMFSSVPNTDGDVAFPLPFTQPANVEFTTDETGGRTIITEMRANGFKWKNVTEKGKEFFGAGSVRWKARGVRAEGK